MVESNAIQSLLFCQHSDGVKNSLAYNVAFCSDIPTKRKRKRETKSTFTIPHVDEDPGVALVFEEGENSIGGTDAFASLENCNLASLVAF